MITLALDIAKKTGWAIGADRVEHSGSWNLGDPPDRWTQLVSHLDRLGNHVGFVAFEAAHSFGYPAATIAHARLEGIVLWWCAKNGIPCRGYSPMTIKKHATGKGTATKDQMVAAAIKKFKRVFEDEDEVDAVWLLDLHLNGSGST